MKRPCMVFGLLIAMVALLSPALFSETPVAILLSCHGEVAVVTGDGRTEEGSFGLPLFEGDEVQTGEESEAEIHFENGTWIVVGARSRLQVKAQPGERKAENPATGAKSFRSVQDFIKLKDYRGSSSIVGLRSAEKCRDLRVVSPCDTKIRGSKPTFEWHCSDPSKAMRIVLYNEEKVHFEKKVSGTTQLPFPDDAEPLEAETSYSWVVETADPLVFPPVRSQAAFFEVISEQEANELDSEFERIEREEVPSKTGYYLTRASLLFDFGLVDEAIRETKLALESDPENGALHAILARLFAEAGRAEEALEEYNRILDDR